MAANPVHAHRLTNTFHYAIRAITGRNVSEKVNNKIHSWLKYSRACLEWPVQWEPPSDWKPFGQNVFVAVYNIYATSNLKPPAFCGHFHCAKGVASQHRFDCTSHAARPVQHGANWWQIHSVRVKFSACKFEEYENCTCACLEDIYMYHHTRVL